MNDEDFGLCRMSKREYLKDDKSTVFMKKLNDYFAIKGAYSTHSRMHRGSDHGWHYRKIK